MWLINPLVSAIYLFRDFKENKSVVPYLLLSCFFGLSFVISTSGGDSERYSMVLIEYHEQNYSLGEVLDVFYSEEDGNLDIYQPAVTWLVSLFTDNVKVLFLIFALVFGYFWFKSLLLIRSYITVPLVGLTLVSFIFLALTNPIWFINGVRMWTAVGIFFYGVLLLNLKNDKKGWYFLILPVFVHFSLLISLVLYIMYKVVPTKNKSILSGVFIATFFFGELNLEVIRDYFEQLPGLIQTRKGYLNEEYALITLESKASLAAHVVVAEFLTKYIVFFITVLMYFHSVYKKKLSSKHFDVLFTTGLYFGSFSNLAASVPSGGRFLVLSDLILCTAFLFFLNEGIKIAPFLRALINTILIYLVIFKIRVGLDFMGIFLFIGSPIVNWFVSDSPIIDIIKSLF